MMIGHKGRLLVVALLTLTLGGNTMQAEHFVDVPGTHWSYDAVQWAWENGWVVGRSLNPPMYYPMSPMTRAEISVLIVRAHYGVAYEPPPATGMFPDVPADYWGARWIERAVLDGLLGPAANGHFYPRSPANRADVAVLLSELER